MNRFLVVAFAGCSIALLGRPARSDGARRAEPTHSVWDSVYTDSQAVRGDSLYKTTCAKCHGVALKGGDEGTPLTGDSFFLNWNGKTLGELHERIRNSMPPDNPKSVPRSAVADIVAYVLAQNHFPAGAASLPPDADRLNDIKIVQTKP